MSTAEEELQALYNELWQIRVVNYFTIAGVAFLTYDILTNLDREIPLIWRYYHDTSNGRGRARRMLVQMLFVFGRYYGLLYLVGYFAVNNHQGFSIPFCKAFYAYCLFAGEILYTTLVDAILVIRLNAMYQIFHGTKGLRKYQIFLVSVVIIEFVISMSVCINTASWILTRVVEPPAGIPWPGCMISENPNNALTLPSWCITILAATIFLALSLNLLYSSMALRFQHLADFTISNIKEELRNIQPLTLMMIRDSVFFYFPMFGVLVASVPVSVIYRTSLAYVTAPMIFCIYSFCASRLIIHTREHFARSSPDTLSGEVDPIHFASRTVVASHAGTNV